MKPIIDRGVIRLLEASRKTRSFPLWLSYIFATLLTLVAAALRYFTAQDVETAPYALFYLVIVICSVVFGRRSGIYVTFLSIIFAAAKKGTTIPNGIEIQIDLSSVALFVFSGIVMAILIEGLNHLYESVNQRSNQLELSDERNRILITDINHRVKNHLTALAGLLHSSRRKVEDETCRDVLLTASNRLTVIAVYDRLHLDQNDATVKVRARGFIEQLCSDLALAIIGERPIEIEADIDDVEITTSKAVPMGLLVNEVVTNAVKHAFTHEGGVISVTLRSSDHHELTIADNGAGGSLGEVEGTGSRLIRSLAQQLNGTVEVSRGQGRKVKVTFPRLS